MKFKTRLIWEAMKYHGKKSLVLNIEISHVCNLNCAFCGRVRGEIKGKLDFEEIKQAIDYVNAPIVYFTGGEPFLHIEDLTKATNYAIEKGKLVMVVTNGTLLDEVLQKFIVKNKEKVCIMFSCDGLRENHNKIRGDGSFEKLEQGILKAKELGFNRFLNLTLFKSNLADLENVIEHFKDRIDQFHLNIFFDFTGDAPKLEKELNDLSKRAVELKKKTKKILNPYLYLLSWKTKELDCTPWATVTLDPSGWRSPCYFVKYDHFKTYQELLDRTDWKRFEKKKDLKCQNCFSHCGFEPTIYRKKVLLIKEIISRIKYVI